MENLPQVPGNQAEVRQNYHARNFVELRLDFLGLGGYFPRIPANRAKDAQNHDARKAVSATLSVLK